MPYGAVPPPVPAVPHNTAAHYGPNMGGRKFQNNKVLLPWPLNPVGMLLIILIAQPIICHFSLSIYEEIRLNEY